MNRHLIWTTVGFGVLGLALHASAAPTTQPMPAESMDRLIEDLGATDVKTREAATARLGELGKAAMPALEKAVESDDPEVQSRARKLIRQASRRLPPAAPPGSPWARPRKISVSSRGGVQTTDVDDNGYRISIKQSASEIRMDVTGIDDGKERTETYTAPDAETLKLDNPEAFALYEKYNANSQNVSSILGLRGVAGGNVVRRDPFAPVQNQQLLDQIRRQREAVLNNLERRQEELRSRNEDLAKETRKLNLDRLRLPLSEDAGNPAPGDPTPEKPLPQTRPAE